MNSFHYKGPFNAIISLQIMFVIDYLMSFIRIISYDYMNLTKTNMYEDEIEYSWVKELRGMWLYVNCLAPPMIFLVRIFLLIPKGLHHCEVVYERRDASTFDHGKLAHGVQPKP